MLFMATKVLRQSVKVRLTSDAVRNLRIVLHNATDNVRQCDRQTALLTLDSSCIAIVDERLNSAEVYDIVDTG